jgi:expansin (peptidoglycan-binding protein)
LPDRIKISEPLAKPLDLIVFFAASQKILKREFPKLAKKIEQDGTLWIAWPKKASGVVTDLSDNSVRQIGLDCGLVDVKVCALNDIWSGLKFVYRLKDRKSL